MTGKLKVQVRADKWSSIVYTDIVRLDYQPLFGKMSPHSSPERTKESLFGEDQRPDPGDGGNRA